MQWKGQNIHKQIQSNMTIKKENSQVLVKSPGRKRSIQLGDGKGVCIYLFKESFELGELEGLSLQMKKLEQGSWYLA